MACTIKVLTTLGDFAADDLINEESRKNVIKSIQQRLENDLQDSYSNDIGYFREYTPNMFPDSEEGVIGCERPDEMREIAKNWNKHIVDRCADAFRNLEKAASDKGYGSISEYMRSLLNKENGYIDDIPYPASLYVLRKCLAPMDDTMVYDSYGDLVHIDDLWTSPSHHTCCVGPVMDRDVREYIVAHPEEFILIKLLYFR